MVLQVAHTDLDNPAPGARLSTLTTAIRIERLFEYQQCKSWNWRMILEPKRLREAPGALGVVRGSRVRRGNAPIRTVILLEQGDVLLGEMYA